MLDQNDIMHFQLMVDGSEVAFRITSDDEGMELFLDRKILAIGGWEGVEATDLEDANDLADAIAFLVKVAVNGGTEFDGSSADDAMGRGINMESEGQRPRNPRSLS